MKKLSILAATAALVVCAAPAQAASSETSHELSSAPEGLVRTVFESGSSASSDIATVIEQWATGNADAEVYLGDIADDILDAVLHKPFAPRRCLEGPAQRVPTDNPLQEELVYKQVVCPRGVGAGEILAPGEGAGPWN
ncbi:hypothetical protein C1Y63_04290 [Corynebacterium sp. 13CS0277]|uniref:hypothetical protein n=1 Tax=Corynebacterium sp. 13CS0277 TaxID=2071994 RepID=UPI000D046956|nr:hypothetical protein [Corynebacterium sp. 13CS0277]PRQ11865.1 hypothetical protein C1Y63_04290 [Corynebacterium sp. 13CS0277]